MEPLAPDSYAQFLADLKSRIQAAQLRPSVAVNRELVLLYWQIGRDILERQQRESWGAKVIDRLAVDLKREFPDMKGFSVRNLKYMRRFAQVWTEDEFVQQVAAQLPWFHNCVLLDKVADGNERIWYARARVSGWRKLPGPLPVNALPDVLCPARHFARIGLKTFSPAKWLSFSVTITQLFASAIAAMIMSSGLRGRPFAVPSAISRAQISPDLSSNASTLPANNLCGPSGPANQRSSS